MQAVSIEGKKQLKVVETETPKSDGNKVIVEVAKVGICGSDLAFVGKRRPYRLIMGHEFCGKVVDPGALKDTLKPGDRVTVLPLNPCGKCVNCKQGKVNLCINGLAASPGLTAPGAYAQYYAARPDMVRALPDEVSDAEATMIEPTAVALRAVHHAGVKPGDKVLVTGWRNYWIFSVLWARIAGASYIALTEANPKRAKKHWRWVMLMKHSMPRMKNWPKS